MDHFHIFSYRKHHRFAGLFREFKLENIKVVDIGNEEIGLYQDFPDLLGLK